MLRMRSKADLYRELSFLSSRLVEAARAGDWESFATVQRGVGQLRDDLRSCKGKSTLAASDMEQFRCLIQRILEDDAEVRRYTEPWLENLWSELGMQGANAPSDRVPGEDRRQARGPG
jgi:flagellar protein FliT